MSRSSAVVEGGDIGISLFALYPGSSLFVPTGGDRICLQVYFPADDILV
jgi:hypothetical protein